MNFAYVRVSTVGQNEERQIETFGGGDAFQSGICIENIMYCPICGRKLSNK